MLFLPPIECSSFEFLTKKNILIEFLIGDKLYFLSDSDHSIHGSIHSMDTKTFEIENLEVEMDENLYDPDFYAIRFGGLENIYETAVVHNKCVYIWDYNAQFFYEGKIEKNKVHWSKVRTKGSKQFSEYAVSFASYHESDSNFNVIQSEDDEEEEGIINWIIYSINLNDETMTWERHPTWFKDESTTNFFENNPFESDDFDRIFFAAHKIHFFSTKYDDYVTTAHLILDISQLDWSIDTSYTEQKGLPHPRKSEIFSDNNRIWMLSDTNNACQSIIRRYDLESSGWIEMGTISDDNSFFRSRSMPVCVGTRVVFLNSSSRQRANSKSRPLFYVLELEPTLFDLAVVTMAKDRGLSRLGLEYLPEGIINYLIDTRMVDEEEEEEE
ncbi:hypothetical protein PMAYCL1PPCAC_12889, partial [Pristionchus mayeri]